MSVILNLAHTHIYIYMLMVVPPYSESNYDNESMSYFIIHTKTSILDGTFISLMEMDGNILLHRILYILSRLFLVYQREEER